MAWSADGRTLFIRRDAPDPAATLIARFDLATGRIEPLREIAPPDAAGLTQRPFCVVTPDGRTIVYSVRQYLTDLYMVEGLR